MTILVYALVMLDKSQPWLDCFFCETEKTVGVFKDEADSAEAYLYCERCGATGPRAPVDEAKLKWQNINVAQRVIKIIATMDLPK